MAQVDGLSLKIICDNGLPFPSCELKSWPQANGEIERFMQPLTKVIRAAYNEQKDWVAALHELVFAYRVTPYSSTNVPPADLMFQPRIRYFIPDATNKLNNHIDLEGKLKFNDWTNKELATDYATLRRHAKSCSFSVGDHVLVKQPCNNGLSSPFNPYSYCIIAQKGSVFATKNSETDHEITRNQTHFKSIPEQAIALPVIPDSEEEGERIARFNGSLEPNLRPAFPPKDHSISIENTNPPRKVYPCRFRRPVYLNLMLLVFFYFQGKML